MIASPKAGDIGGNEQTRKIIDDADERIRKLLSQIPCAQLLRSVRISELTDNPLIYGVIEHRNGHDSAKDMLQRHEPEQLIIDHNACDVCIWTAGQHLDGTASPSVPRMNIRSPGCIDMPSDMNKNGPPQH